MHREIDCCKLLYQAKVHGFKGANFTSLCNNKGPTICFIKTDTGRIFGGYTPISWDGTSQF